MSRRTMLTLVAVAVFIAVIGLVKFLQIRGAIAQASSFQPPPEAVTTVVARLEPWQASVKAIGTVEAVQGVIVSADLPGVVERIAFESGKTVRAGDVLVRLEASQERAQLAAVEAQRDLVHLTLERMRELRENGVISQAEYDRTSAESRQAEARVSEIRATIERKTIRAPFDGVLGIRRVNLGQHLMGGDPIVPLQARHPVYVNFSVPQQQVGDMQADAEVRLTVEGMAEVAFTGRITAINAIVDETTRNVQVQATFDNPDGRLRPGMFVEAQVLLPDSSPVVALPASAILYAPYGDAVFIVQDIQGPDGKTSRGVRQQFVKLGGARGDQVAVLSGVRPGDEVVTSGVFKLRNGAAVQVNNEIQPANDPAPKPEDG
ncbi:MAG: efflux RND transporter periplasmic adaptor subunit [Candidatus Latescibacteria bacterium]|nr:efflux RND transporter periplasmic adaptor subunit [Candidatus Latescibacterota bacterium]